MSFAKNIRHILKSQLQAISNAFIVYFVLSGHDKKDWQRTQAPYAVSLAKEMLCLIFYCHAKNLSVKNGTNKALFPVGRTGTGSLAPSLTRRRRRRQPGVLSLP